MIGLDGTVIREPLTGVHYAVRHQLRALLDHCGAASSVVLATDVETAEFAKWEGAAVPRLSPGLRHVWRRVLWQQRTLPKLLRRHACQALFAPAYTAPRNCPVDVVLQVHDTIALNTPELCSRLNALHMRTLMPPSIREAARIVTPSTPVANEVMRLFDVPAARIHPVGLGVDPIFLNHRQPLSLPAKWGIGTRPYLLYVSTIEPKKGVDVLLEAYASVAALHEVDLVLAGKPGWRCGRELATIRSWRRPGCVRELGYVPRAFLPTLMAGAAAVVMPSTVEGFGLPVIEAMAVGTAVVHSDHPVLCETAAGHGYDAASRDPASFARVIGRVLDQSQDESNERAEAARKYAASRTWQRWADEICSTTGLCDAGDVRA
jgi:glycosyltransferase involved in cell wall biosynthesis